MPKQKKRTAAQEAAAKATEKADQELLAEQPTPAQIAAATKAFPKIMAGIHERAAAAAVDPQTTLFGSIRKKEKARHLLSMEILATQRLIEKHKAISFHDRKPVARDPFVMLPMEILTANDINDFDIRVFGILQAHARKKASAWPSQDRVAHLLHKDVRTVQRSLRRLADRGYILVQIRRQTNGVRYMNQYALNLADDRGRNRP